MVMDGAPEIIIWEGVVAGLASESLTADFSVSTTGFTSRARLWLDGDETTTPIELSGDNAPTATAGVISLTIPADAGHLVGRTYKGLWSYDDGEEKPICHLTVPVSGNTPST